MNNSMFRENASQCTAFNDRTGVGWLTLVDIRLACQFDVADCT
jgi:hypothetical protein